MEFRFTIALIYDFDGTLAPGNMQEYDFIPAVGKSNKEFWTEANTLAEEQDADMVLTYMARMIQEAKDRGMLIDASFGRRTRSVVIMDTDHVILSAIQPEILTARANGRTEETKEEEEPCWRFGQQRQIRVPKLS